MNGTRRHSLAAMPTPATALKGSKQQHHQQQQNQFVKNRKQSFTPGRSVRPDSIQYNQSIYTSTNTAAAPPLTSSSIAVPKDPRPIKQREFQRACIQRLITFLVQHEYPHDISEKMLMSPTSSVFKEIMTGLMSLVDPPTAMTLQYDPKRFEHQVCAFFKSVRYPFNISRASLSAVGTSHTWPGMLAALTWVVELLEYQELVESYSEKDAHAIANANANANAAANNSVKQEELAFFELTKDAYAAFMTGDDETHEELKQSLRDAFEKRHQAMEDQVARLEQELGVLEEDLEKENARESELQTTKRRVKTLQGDVESFDNVLSQWNRKLEATQAKLTSLEKKRDKEKARLEEEKKRYAELNEVLDTQELSAADVDRMTKEGERIRKELRETTTKRESVQEDIWSAAREFDQSWSKNVTEVAEEYNNKVAALGNNMQLRIEVPTYEEDCYKSRMELSFEVPEQVKDTLRELNEMAIKKRTGVRNEVLELQEKALSLAEEQTKAEEDVGGLEKKLSRLNEQYNDDQATLQAELKQVESECDDLEATLHSIKFSTTTEAESGSHHNVWNELREARAQLKNEANEWNKEELKLAEEMHTALESVVAHKQEMETLLTENGLIDAHKGQDDEDADADGGNGDNGDGDGDCDGDGDYKEEENDKADSANNTVARNSQHHETHNINAKLRARVTNER